MAKSNEFAPAQRLNIKTIIANPENVVEHAGSGFQLPESTARLLDERAKELPKDFTYRRLAASPAEFDLPEGERTDVSFITTDAVDRDGEVVLPQGIDWKNYNGCVQPFHDYKQLPVGVSWWIRPRMAGIGNGLIAKTYYPTKPEGWGDSAPWLPSAILHLMQMPIPVCTGKSIGFLPLEIRNATPEEKSKRPDWKDKPIISRSLGLEYSVVSIPANSDAEMEAVSKGVKAGEVPDLLADLLAKSLNLKDSPILATGTAATASMPNCPKCMNNEQVQKKDDGGTYLCMKCQTEFSAKDASDAEEQKAAAEAAQKEVDRKLTEALSAPYFTESAYQSLKTAEQRKLADWAAGEAQRRIVLAVAAAAGQV